LKSFPRTPVKVSLLLVWVAVGVLGARAAMPEWIQNIEARSLVEAAIFRTVSLPSGTISIRRPPAESVPALGELVKQHPQQADLYSLKALEEEQKLDFAAAESDWKLYLQNASDKVAAQMDVADFYHRRLRPQDEVNALTEVGSAPSPPSERFSEVSAQRSWLAFERSLQVIQAQALGKNAYIELYNAWMARYPQEPGLYGRYFEFLLNEKDFKAAADLIAKYHTKFAGDETFPTKARALLAYNQGSVQEGLAVYETHFQPLWPPELIKNYFDLVRETRSLRKFLDQAHAALARNPDDLNAAARVFYYYQQQGNLQAAQQAIAEYRLQKDARKTAWTAQELYTFARLLDAVHLYPEAARYYFALYNSPGADSSEKALAGLTNILLIAPEQQIRFGAGDISMYKDIATMDSGPGYLNGILSLVLNTSAPANHYSEEEQRALSYFHRSRAAELVALFDKRFSNSPSRPELHARLIEAYANYGEDAAVLNTGNEFLAAFPLAPQRNQVALLMADSYARVGDTKAEFALYDTLLQELARKADGMPLGESADQEPARISYEPPGTQQSDAGDDEEGEQPRPQNIGTARQAFTVQKSATQSQAGVRSPEYQRVLDRYISRLVSLKKVTDALSVWRQELDRNPNDPGLYEKFATFLENNQLGTEEEAIYKRAIQQFQGTNWYHKLARWYLRKKRDQDLHGLSQQVLQIFSGSDLERYLRSVSGMPQQLDLRFNQLAHERFPHNLAFVRNLLQLYETRHFSNHAAWERLLRQYWFADQDLRNQFFQHLSNRGKLDGELEALRATIGAGHDWMDEAKSNPASVRFIGEAELWRSHFEAGAPVIAAVARQYPADAEMGERASSVYRSLAYFDPRKTEAAVEIESNLLRSMPGDRQRLARIGDIYSDREQFSKAAPYWNKMPETEPGRAQSYEDAAAVFWDYYFFEDALRLLNQGRRNLRDYALYSYQVGAIYEDKQDYARAVDEYLKGALAESANAESRARLLQLATRKPARDAVDAATERAVVISKYELSAIQLRVEVLEAQGRKPDLSGFLISALDHSGSVETLESIENMAREKSLESVRQHALERQAAVSTDPIRRLELRYALASFYERKKDFAAAQQNVEALYKDNPKILGVVRSTVDFYWRNKLQQRAIDVLAQAAKDSYPALKTSFSYDQARKMTDVGRYAAARKLLLALLADSPYNSEYLAATAETYARAGDNAGLRDFYQNEIKAFQKASLAADERKDRIAALRRGLIPALTALKDYAGGVDQYVEIINSYPEDAGLTSEAAYYSQRYQRKDQFLNFYARTVAASPKDSRWTVVLARAQASLEDFDAAIRTYGQAIKIRSDRTDLLTARAAMEERLMRFDEAAADYASLYELAYHDARWMEKVAEIRARQNKPEQAVQALKMALIDGRPETPGKYFTMSERLESWGMLAPAREYAEKGVALADKDFLANSDNHAGAQTYTRIMTRLRQQEASYQTLQGAIASAKQLPSVTQQVAKNGIEAVTNTELRKSLLATRTGNARNGMIACMREMGTAVNRYFTPEERAAFGKSLEARNAVMTRREAYDYLLPAAEKAGIADLQVKLITAALAAQPMGGASTSSLEQLQIRRLKLMELGKQLEQIALAAKSNYAISYLTRAQEIYAMAGSPDDELRVLEKMKQYQLPAGQRQNRYFELLLAKNPQQLVRLAAQPDGRGDEAVNFLMAHSDARLALPAVDVRSASEPAVWRSAYVALAGLYFNDGSVPVQSAFVTALADGTIGQRITQPIDRKQALAGDVWFYYGSRYGEYLGTVKKGDPEDFLAAELEHTPTRAAAYFATALYYEEAGDLVRAVSDYQHVLELSPERIDVHNRLAGIYWKQKYQDRAVTEWKRALELLKAQTTTGKTQETFWGDFAATITNLADHKLMSQFQPDVNELLHGYVKRNGIYRIEPLMRSMLPRLESPAAATALVLELSIDAPEKLSFLRQFVATSLNFNLDREPVYRHLLELMRDKIDKAEGVEREYAQQALEQLEVEWLEYLRDNKQYDRVRSGLAELPRPVWDRRTQLFQIQLKMAAQTGGLDSIVGDYRTDPDHAPSAEVMRKTATEMQLAGDKQSARKVLEFVFTREIENRNLTAANMLGLADIRIQAGDLEGAMGLLRRMTLAVGNAFETQDPAAALLMRNGHAAEATVFLEELVRAVPWNSDYRVRLAQARLAAGPNAEAANKDLLALASASNVAYETRLAAAKSLSGVAPDLGSRELNLMVAGQPASVNDANQPYFFAARLKAAESEPAAARIVLLCAALEDNPAGEAARVPLLKAASETGDYNLAIATMKPYLTGGKLDSAVETQGSDESDEAGTQDGRMENPAGAFARLSAKEYAEISRDLGIAFKRTGSLAQAVPYLQRAYRLDTDAAVKAQINKDVQQIRLLQRRRAANRARQPDVHSALEQEHVVRPRLPEPVLFRLLRPQSPARKGAGL
jgi:tetratricopeptide (TPR) repeat protein/Tfp pilus assembly protein PilF